METLLQDIRYGLRMLAKNPGFTSVAVLTLALGIGANTAIFTLIDALMLRWLPVRNPQELVQLRIGANDPGESFSYPIVLALADQKDIFSGVAGFSGFNFNVGDPGSEVRVQGAVVTGGYYETLGLTPVVGRLLTQDDDRPGAALVGVISYGYWERQFARSPEVVGRTLLMNGAPVTIIGVSPHGFVGANVGSIANIAIPVAALAQVDPRAAPLLERGNFWLRVLARPRRRVSIAAAKARLATVWPQICDPLISPRWSASRRKAMADAVFQWSPGGTGWTYLREMYRKPLWVLMGAVGLVLLIACANLVSLLLARASARQNEIAVRLAIGAGQGRIIRQLLTEATLLSLAGAVLGILLAWLSSGVLVKMISTREQLVFDLTPNWHVLVFTTAVAIGTAVLFGVAPALQVTAAGPSPVLKQDARMIGSRLRSLPSLVSGQIALSLALLICAGLFVRTLHNLQNVDPGFNREGVLLVDLEGRRVALPLEIVREIERIPGVLSASVSTHTPLSGSVWSDPAVPKGQPVPERDNAYFIGAGPRFFETMQIPLLAGREFTEHDSANNPDVAIINDAFAHRFFAAQNPVGQFLSAPVRGQRRDLEVVGLVKNTSLAGLRAAAPPTVYVSYAQLTGNFPTTLEVRATGPLGQVASAVHNVLQPRVPGPPVDIRSFSSQVEATMVRENLMATLASGFGLLALILACIGLYGLMAYSVVLRTGEIGVRIALGAQQSNILWLVLHKSLTLVVIGVGIGIPVALAATRLASSLIAGLLFGLKATDPGTIAVATLLLVGVALLAGYLPARRATKIDPMVALRYE